MTYLFKYLGGIIAVLFVFIPHEFAHAFVAYKCGYIHSVVSCYCMGQFVALGMYGSIVEDVFSVRYSEESGRLLECLFAHSRYVHQFFP